MRRAGIRNSQDWRFFKPAGVEPHAFLAGDIVLHGRKIKVDGIRMCCRHGATVLHVFKNLYFIAITTICYTTIMCILFYLITRCEPVSIPQVVRRELSVSASKKESVVFPTPPFKFPMYITFPLIGFSLSSISFLH